MTITTNIHPFRFLVTYDMELPEAFFCSLGKLVIESPSLRRWVSNVEKKLCHIVPLLGRQKPRFTLVVLGARSYHQHCCRKTAVDNVTRRTLWFCGITVRSLMTPYICTVVPSIGIPGNTVPMEGRRIP